MSRVKTGGSEEDDVWGEKAPDFYPDYEWNPPKEYASNRMFYTNDDDEEEDD